MQGKDTILALQQLRTDDDTARDDGIDAPAPLAPMDAEQMRDVYEENVKAIYYFIYGKVQHRELAEDLTSQVFLKAVRALDGTREPASIRSWLFHIAQSRIADYYRSLYRLRTQSLEELPDVFWDTVDAGEATSASGESEQAAESVESLFERLPERYRDVLRLRFLMNRSLKEAAEHMHTSVNALKVLQGRALKKARGIGLDEHSIRMPEDGCAAPCAS